MQLPKPASSGSFVSLKNQGDSVVGLVTKISGDGRTMANKEFPDGQACPLLELDVDGSDMKLTCSQVQLWTKVVELVETGVLTVGKMIKVEVTRIEPRGQGRTLKHFEVLVKDPDPALVAAVAQRDEPF